MSCRSRRRPSITTTGRCRSRRSLSTATAAPQLRHLHAASGPDGHVRRYPAGAGQRAGCRRLSTGRSCQPAAFVRVDDPRDHRCREEEQDETGLQRRHCLILLTQLGFAVFGEGLWSLAFFLFVFFVGFNILEASLPSMISALRHRSRKALRSAYIIRPRLSGWPQGPFGGFLAQRFGADAVFAVCGLLTLVWLGFGLTMAPLPVRVKPGATPVAAQTN